MGRKDAPTTHDPHEMFTPEQIEIVKRMVTNEGGTDADAARFVEVCKIRRLNPIAGQIHAMFRNNNEGTKAEPRWVKKMTVQTGIDAYRLIAERSGKYEGQTKTEWCDQKLVWYDVWPFTDKPPFACRMGVHRAGFREPMVKTATFSEYAQTNRDGTLNRMWHDRGPAQLAKCCEALCLRAAFPEELGGLYTDDEMAQASNEDKYAHPAETPKTEAPKPPPPSTPAAKPAAPQTQAPATPPSTPAQAPASAPTAAADPVAYVVAASDKLPGGLNAVEQWCKQVLGESWLKVRRDLAKVARVVTALDAGGIGDYAPAKSAPATPAAGGVVCKCGTHVEGNAEFCSNCGDPIPDSKSVFRNGGAK
jgi:phage recombination protein Bet